MCLRMNSTTSMSCTLALSNALSRSAPSLRQFCRQSSTLGKTSAFFKNAVMGWKHMTGQIPPTLREQQELQELRMALLSINYKQLSLDDPSRSFEDEMHKVWNDFRGVKNIGMRHEVQVELVPEILDVFEVFHHVDRQMRSVINVDVLTHDYEETLREEQSNTSIFLTTKRSALETLLRHSKQVNWISPKPLPWESSTENMEWDQLLDDFGYNGKEASDEVYMAIREQQTRNMVRSYLIKQELGYSVLALKSGIPKAGRGIYVDGMAPPGSILAFFPGQVWPREYLLDPPKSIIKHLSWQNNPNCQLHFRGDDFLLDCRASPYTVLENPWAIAHIANHAPINKSNCRSMGINFFEKMQLPATLWQYVPNEYAKPPTTMGGRLLDREVIEMHGMCLLSKRRELCNEELLFDYRLYSPPDGQPGWYEEVDYDFEGGIHEQ